MSRDAHSIMQLDTLLNIARGNAFRRFPERERRVSASRSFALRNGRSDLASASPRPRACHATRVTAGRLNQAEEPRPVKPNETSGQTGVAENYPPLPGLSLSLSLCLLKKKMDERAEPETAEQSRLPLFPLSLPSRKTLLEPRLFRRLASSFSRLGFTALFHSGGPRKRAGAASRPCLSLKRFPRPLAPATVIRGTIASICREETGTPQPRRCSERGSYARSRRERSTPDGFGSGRINASNRR